MSDNVIEFPGQKKSADELSEELKEKGSEAVLDRLEKNRAKALQQLEQKIDDLENHPVSPDPAVEAATRDIIAGLKACLLGIESLDAFYQMVAHDIGYLSQQNDQLGFNLFQAGSHVQVLLGILQEKGIVTKEDLKAGFEKVIPEAVREVQEAIGNPDYPGEQSE